MIHDLQQNVVDIRMGFLDFVQQHDGVRMLIDAIGQKAALVEADIAGRSPKKARNRYDAPYIPTCRSAAFQHRVTDASCLATSVLPTPVGPEKT